MPIADSKKVQTALNLLKERVVDKVVAADNVAELIRQAIIDEGLTSFFTAPELAGLVTLSNDLSAVAALPAITVLQDRYKETHIGNTITIAGVND